ncbi:hypothetical protein HX004_15420 [Myroides sp. 1354]|uniref:hypothetical protein n=1 Tax=unclassified Myroides TaxID=2642485 RepID=UPI002576819A|nr:MULTISPECIES: hypothetical protein [unclassified Myroides]MDM1046212.1 hypothetical protein [Myroides sp. R163-1]MDM1057148.1 hypothetical protein [Myroides sp. 1354]MDM1070343.1 hypothetical protein [Myroides sp. 1372]
MRKAFGLFWLFFFLYFIFAHPAIIYYGSEYPRRYLDQVNPTETFVYLGMSFVLWTIVLGVLLAVIFKYTIQTKWNINKINQRGKRIEARIVQASGSTIFEHNTAIKSLVLALHNFEGESIRHMMEVRDSKPEERRFEEGKHIHLRVDSSFKQRPYVIVEGTKGKVNGWFFVGWLLFFVGIVYYYVFSYQLESQGFGWRFLTLSHPLLSSAGFLILFAGILYLIAKFLIFKKLNIGSSSLALKFRGKRVNGTVVQVQQTGTYINEQPEVRFDVEYSDDKGIVHQVVLKKIVSLLEVGSVKHQTSCMLFYDPKEPKKVQFEQDINPM